jgi:diketogulonate reductase-like aldo/keto reductase
VNEIAAGYGASSAQVALAWVRVQQDKSVVIPIVGARTPAQFKENLGALEVSLSPADLERLDEVSRIELGFPHDFAGAALAYGQHVRPHRQPPAMIAKELVLPAVPDPS